MLTKNFKFKLVLSGISWFFLWAKLAHAYIDPGTGSYFFQLLIAGLLSSLFFAKNIIRAVNKFFLKNIFSKKNKDNVSGDNKN